MAKKRICAAFREKTGLIIDVVKQGSGTSDDGNTARRFFSDPELTAEITGVNLELIERFAYSLHKLTSLEATDLDEFQKYTFETAQLYVRLCPCYTFKFQSVPPVIRFLTPSERVYFLHFPGTNS